MRALVVDDSRIARLMLRNVLEKHGFEVVEAADGREALTHLTAPGAPPSLALFDWNMPQMTGHELIRIVRTRRELDQMPIVVVSSEQEERHIQQMYGAGANAYVTKPFDERALLDKLTGLGLAIH